LKPISPSACGSDSTRQQLISGKIQIYGFKKILACICFILMQKTIITIYKNQFYETGVASVIECREQDRKVSYVIYRLYDSVILSLLGS
jgi:hypothetical protein